MKAKPPESLLLLNMRWPELLRHFGLFVLFLILVLLVPHIPTSSGWQKLALFAGVGVSGIASLVPWIKSLSARPDGRR